MPLISYHFTSITLRHVCNFTSRYSTPVTSCPMVIQCICFPLQREKSNSNNYTKAVGGNISMADSPDSERSGAGWTEPSSPAAPSQPTESPDSGTKVKVTQATVLNIAISCPSQLGFFKYTVLVLFTLQLNTPGFFYPVYMYACKYYLIYSMHIKSCAKKVS